MYDTPRGTIPPLDIKKKINYAPHVVILGAGASRACCLNGDKNGKVLPVMNDFYELVDLNHLIKKIPISPVPTNLEDIYSTFYNLDMQDELSSLEAIIQDYFRDIQIPNTITIYDKLILSLRKKDVIITFNWDPLLCQAFQRLRLICDQLPTLIFLHGNIDVAIDIVGRKCKFTSDLKGDDFLSFEPSRLLYPIKQKNYTTDGFIKEQWAQAAWYLERAYMVTIFGYSAPLTDIEARKILLKAWQANTSKVFAEFEFIDISPRETIEKLWDEFTISHHYSVIDKFERSYLCNHPRRTCEAFAFATLQQQPWSEDNLPNFRSFKDISAWLKPYITEESAEQLSEKPKSI